MDTIAAETGSFGTLLLPIQGRIPNAPYSTSMGPFVERYLAEGWYARDFRYKSVPAALKKGVATDLDIISPDDMKRSEYYQELLAPHKLQWMAGIAITAGDDMWAVVLQRTTEQGPFQAEELNQIANLRTLLTPATTLARALNFARAEGALAAFDLSHTGAIMLNSSGEAIKVNAEAERMFDGDLKIIGRRLRSRSAAASAALDKAIYKVLWRADYVSAPAIALPKELGRSVVANVLRADSISMEALSPARAFVLLIDPDREIVTELADLISIFGLTKSEARLAVELQNAQSLLSAALKLNTTYETVRTTLKQIFRKTETASQADLMRLVSKLLPSR